ncbi:unnamed protein product [Discula destructiva]
MHRLALQLTRAVPRGTGLPTTTTSTTSTVRLAPAVSSLRSYATSSPKDAEKASAQSGGSRSKDALEAEEEKDSVNDNKNNAAWNSTEAKGRTGGGEPLEASDNPPPRPKILNASVPGAGPNKLTKEQQEEVDRHNAEFEKRADRASSAEDDKVDKSFWKGQNGHGTR